MNHRRFLGLRRHAWSCALFLFACAPSVRTMEAPRARFPVALYCASGDCEPPHDRRVTVSRSGEVRLLIYRGERVVEAIDLPRPANGETVSLNLAAPRLRSHVFGGRDFVILVDDEPYRRIPNASAQRVVAAALIEEARRCENTDRTVRSCRAAETLAGTRTPEGEEARRIYSLAQRRAERTYTAAERERQQREEAAAAEAAAQEARRLEREAFARFEALCTARDQDAPPVECLDHMEPREELAYAERARGWAERYAALSTTTRQEHAERWLALAGRLFDGAADGWYPPASYAALFDAWDEARMAAAREGELTAHAVRPGERTALHDCLDGRWRDDARATWSYDARGRGDVRARPRRRFSFRVLSLDGYDAGAPAYLGTVVRTWLDRRGAPGESERLRVTCTPSTLTTIRTDTDGATPHEAAREGGEAAFARVMAARETRATEAQALRRRQRAIRRERAEGLAIQTSRQEETVELLASTRPGGRFGQLVGTRGRVVSFYPDGAFAYGDCGGGVWWITPDGDWQQLHIRFAGADCGVAGDYRFTTAVGVRRRGGDTIDIQLHPLPRGRRQRWRSRPYRGGR